MKGEDVTRVGQAAQFRLGGAAVGVLETDGDDTGRWAVFGYRNPDGSLGELALEEGESGEVPGAGRIELVAVQPSTEATGRGCVAIRIG